MAKLFTRPVAFVLAGAMATLPPIGDAPSRAIAVTVDAGAVGGTPTVDDTFAVIDTYPIYYEGPSDPAVEAFSAAGIKHTRVVASFEVEPWHGYGVVVTKVDGEVRLDFSNYDPHMRTILDEFKAEPLFTLAWMPRALSRNPTAPDYYTYPPRNWADWEEVVRQFVEHNHKPRSEGGLGIPWAAYEVWNEPESNLIWKGGLNGYVELYERSVAGLESAFPAAWIGGPVTAHWDSVNAGGHPWGLPQFLEKAQERNLRLDLIIWHHYWTERLSDGMDYVDDLVGQLGYATEARYAITEWNSEISSIPGTCRHPRYRKASHMVNNMIRETVGPSSVPNPRLWRAWWYMYKNLGGLGGADECYFNLVTTLPSSSRTRDFCRHATYATTQMLNAMSAGEYLAAKADSPLVVMATRESTSTGVRALVNNHTGSSKRATVTFSNLPFGPAVAQRIQRVDASHSNGDFVTRSGQCSGLEPGVIREVASLGGSLTVNLSLPAYGSALITLSPGG